MAPNAAIFRSLDVFKQRLCATYLKLVHFREDVSEGLRERWVPPFNVTNTELRERKPVRVPVIHDFGLKFNELLPPWAWIVLARITW